LLAALALLVPQCGGATISLPIQNGVLQNPLNANQQDITNARTVVASNVNMQSFTMGGTTYSNVSQLGGGGLAWQQLTNFVNTNTLPMNLAGGYGLPWGGLTGIPLLQPASLNLTNWSALNTNVLDGFVTVNGQTNTGDVHIQGNIYANGSSGLIYANGIYDGGDLIVMGSITGSGLGLSGIPTFASMGTNLWVGTNSLAKLNTNNLTIWSAGTTPANSTAYYADGGGRLTNSINGDYFTNNTTIGKTLLNTSGGSTLYSWNIGAVHNTVGTIVNGSSPAPLAAYGLLMDFAANGVTPANIPGASINGSVATATTAGAVGNAVLSTNVVYVDTNSLGDSFGVVGDILHPFKTLKYVWTNCSNGRTIWLAPNQTFSITSLVQTVSLSIIGNGSTISVPYPATIGLGSNNNFSATDVYFDANTNGISGPFVFNGVVSSKNIFTRCKFRGGSDIFFGGYFTNDFLGYFPDCYFITRLDSFHGMLGTGYIPVNGPAWIFERSKWKLIANNMDSNGGQWPGGYYVQYKDCWFETETNSGSGLQFIGTSQNKTVVDIIGGHLNSDLDPSFRSILANGTNTFVNIYGNPCAYANVVNGGGATFNWNPSSEFVGTFAGNGSGLTNHAGFATNTLTTIYAHITNGVATWTTTP
jgi:hypothetical protein